MNLDIAPFALPNTPRSEIRFEEPRDICRIDVRFRGSIPASLGVAYAQLKWPGTRLAESDADLENPCAFGWAHSDDWFNCKWQQAAVQTEVLDSHSASLIFQPLCSEIEGMEDYPVCFRRTLGVRLLGVDESAIEEIAIFTTSPDETTHLHVELDCGRATPCRTIQIATHNAISDLRDIDCAHSRQFELRVHHMLPSRRYSGDDGLVTFQIGSNAFTISCTSLRHAGPIWFEQLGVYVRLQTDPTTFDVYRRHTTREQTLLDRVARMPEQSLARAMNGQPRPHPVSYVLAWPLHPQRFRLEPNGDLVLEREPAKKLPFTSDPRFFNQSNGRFCFGFESWIPLMRAVGAAPSPSCIFRARLNSIVVEQESVAISLDGDLNATPARDGIIVAMLRFRFTNVNSEPAVAMMQMRYSSESARMRNPRDFIPGTRDDHGIPTGTFETLSISGDDVSGEFESRSVLRCSFTGSMEPREGAQAVVFSQRLEAGESCELLVKVPYVSINGDDEFAQLRALDFETSIQVAKRFWRQWCSHGARISTPEPRLNDIHRAHLMHVAQTDVAMPDGSGLINTSVGTSTYGNFSNESCMIIHDLHERGLFDDARKRLEIWIKYQGTAPQPGNFSDFDGMYFGAGGFEQGAYNQHHGWVLWGLAEHYLFTRDDAWLNRNADSLIAGCDWVFRQRKLTQTKLPHSRGWEHGFLPAGSLEDVTDFYYWLSTNALTWRSVDLAARALASVDHPQSNRIRAEADAYRTDLYRGFELNRQHAPLVRLRNGRWVPHYPSRLYCRGRDIGWIRETLEGSIYLLISGLYPSDGTEAKWILDDYQDNRYASPPYGYTIPDFTGDWFCRAGFSIQPGLLAGLMPHLDRDEPEIAIWMFFNAFAACYRDEIGAIVEHPFPQLGYSNAAHFKTSDQANMMVWLRHLLVHYTNEGLYLGRAIPRSWLNHEVTIRDYSTPFGQVSMTLRPNSDASVITAEIDLSLHASPRECTLQLRHPRKLPIRKLTFKHGAHGQLKGEQGHIELPTSSATLMIVAEY